MSNLLFAKRLRPGGCFTKITLEGCKTCTATLWFISKPKEFFCKMENLLFFVCVVLPFRVCQHKGSQVQVVPLLSTFKSCLELWIMINISLLNFKHIVYVFVPLTIKLWKAISTIKKTMLIMWLYLPIASCGLKKRFVTKFFSGISKTSVTRSYWFALKKMSRRLSKICYGQVLPLFSMNPQLI